MGTQRKDRPEPVARAHAIRQRLLNLAHQQRLDFQEVLRRYALERLLYRLSASPYRDRFVLKGALLFTLWGQTQQRATRDLDVLGWGEPTPERFTKVLQELCEPNLVEVDGLEWDASSIQVEVRREGEQYPGLRATLRAYLAVARIAVVIDVGFGDAITPAPVLAQFPLLLSAPPLPAPFVLAYPPETVVAEKLEALVRFGFNTTRVKDLYDLWVLGRQCTFAGPLVCAAIQATFTRRATPLPQEIPVALSAAFAQDPQKQAQWTAFLTKGKLSVEGQTLDQVLAWLQEFVLPPMLAAATHRPFEQQWLPGGPWSTASRPPGP